MLGAEILPADGPEALLEAYERRGRFETVLLVDGTSYPSSISLGEEQIPADLRELVGDGQLAYERTEAADTRYLVTGGRVPGGEGAEAYFFFSEEELWDDIAQLGTSSWLASGSSSSSGLAGALIARRRSPRWRARARPPLPRRRSPRHTPAGRELGRVRALGGVVQRDGRRARRQDHRPLGGAGARAAVHRRRRARAAHAADRDREQASLLADHIEQMPAEARRPAELLVEDVKRLRDLVEDLMEISRLDAGTQPVRPRRVDLGSLVETAVRARGWQERVQSTPTGWSSSPTRGVERIVANLVGNALEHGGREVAVRVGRDGLGAFVEVADRGPGSRAKIFRTCSSASTRPIRRARAAAPGSGSRSRSENARLLGATSRSGASPASAPFHALRLPVTEPLPAGEEDVASDRQA